MLENSLNQSFNSSFGKNHSVIVGIPEESEEIIAQNDGGDSLSDDSDDTSYSTWKRPPPPDKRIHRYLDEMRVSVNAGGFWLSSGLFFCSQLSLMNKSGGHEF